MDTILEKCQKCGAMHFSYEKHECNLNRMIGYSQAKEEVYEILSRMTMHELIDNDVYSLIKGEMGEVERVRSEERQF